MRFIESDFVIMHLVLYEVKFPGGQQHNHGMFVWSCEDKKITFVSICIAFLKRNDFASLVNIFL